ncbi:FCS-Like Zinc finger 6-like [Curcuma longa]|uniref:FCS-Like Zinc finger 6-like n=1 Tax=Curcuma longa TaxID=136217 RepID=UPI003D9F1979
MLLGKRSRPPMRRTTSSLEFPDGGVSFDVEAPQPLDQGESIGGQPLDPRWGEAEVARRAVNVAGVDWRAARFVGSMLSPRGGVQRSNPVELPGDHPGTAPFLRACGLCNRRLGPGRDAFMYRGEIAFCSLECRQEHISLDVPSATQEP